MSSLTMKALEFMYRRGYEVRRHPAVRRARMLAAHEVDLVIDVGAAVGGYGSQLRKFGYAGDIVSFEPLDTAYAELSAVTGSDARWSTRQAALGSAAGEAQINIASNSDSSSLLPMGSAHTDAEPSVGIIGSQTVRVERLDDVIDEFARPESRIFLKIDAQGFEREVLAGAAKTLERCRGLQLELSFISLYEGGMLVNEAISLAYDAGFSMVGVEQGWAAGTGQMLQADGVFFRL
ncbi:FkbM family methyltransferase [Nocardioides marmoriginsengisoli]|uniref:FkbM family methyltransferase n=1 Tax=Nocardioides marmoriginsengisoli TaxID=661483 RepID=UPI001619DDDD|nr:FkbM family methyltransferase [Nocardioides marmoriginsengisoli]